MSTIRKLVKNIGVLLLGRFLTKAISFFIVIYTVRYLGEVGYGKYSFAIAFVSFFFIIPYLGIHEVLVREIAKNPKIAGKALGNASIIQFILGIIALALVILSCIFLGYPNETIKIIILASLGLLLSGLSPIGVIYEVNFRNEYAVFFGVLSRIILLISLLIIIFYDLGLSWIIIASVVADAIHSIVMVFYSKRFVKLDFNLDTTFCRYLLKEALPIALTSVFITIYFRIDVIMLSMMKGDSEVGIYSAATRLTEALLFLSSTFMVSMFPLMSRYFSDSPKTLPFIYRKSVKYLFILALPIAVGVTFFSDKIILLMYGDQFQNTSNVLKILIWATGILFINDVTNFLLISSNKQKFVTISTAIGAVLNTGLNFILIPKYSYQGAAFATVITELSLAVMLIYFLPSGIFSYNIFDELHAPIKATVAMSIFILLASMVSTNLLIIIPSILIYFISLYIFGVINEEDKKLISKLTK
jgi:O-antigen/teichoic acid export membrane protein